MSLRLNPPLQLHRISWCHGVKQDATSTHHASNNMHVVARGEVGLDTELPLQVILSGKDRDVGVGVRSIVSSRKGPMRGSNNGWAPSGMMAHNL